MTIGVRGVIMYTQKNTQNDHFIFARGYELGGNGI